MLNNYTRVRLLTDTYQEAGAFAGDTGYVIETYDNGDYEVEFSHADGTTFAQITAILSDLQAIEPVLAAAQN